MLSFFDSAKTRQSVFYPHYGFHLFTQMRYQTLPLLKPFNSKVFLFGRETRTNSDWHEFLSASRHLFLCVYIDLIHKWRSIYNSFVEVQISLPSLDTIQWIEKNSCSKMRLGRLICTWTKELKMWPPFMNTVYALDWPDNELRPVWLRLGCWTETRNILAGLSSYRPRVNVNSLRSGPEISSLYAFGSAIHLSDKTYHFIQKRGTKHLVPVLRKLLQTFHTGLSSSRSYVNTH